MIRFIVLEPSESEETTTLRVFNCSIIRMLYLVCGLNE